MKKANIKSSTGRENKKKKINIKPNLNFDNIKKKNWKIIIIIISIVALIVVGLVVIIVVLKSKKKDDEEKVESDELNQNNYQVISSDYNVSKGKEFRLFNPEKAGLNEQDYSVQKEEDQGKSRLLSGIEQGKMTLDIGGKVKLKIIIKKNVFSLSGLFSNITNLQSIDFTGFNINLVHNFDCLFEGCESLEDVKFPIDVVSANVISMNNMFKGCASLTFVNLTSFTITDKTSLAGIFAGCLKLKEVDISSFNFITADFFNGIGSDVNLLLNTYLTNKINNSTDNVYMQIKYILNQFSWKNIFDKK